MSADPAQKSGRPEGGRRWAKVVSIGALGTLVGVAGGVLTDVYAIHPSWKPDPGVSQVANAKVVAVDKSVSIRDYAKRIGREVPSGIGAPSVGSRSRRTTVCLPGNVYYVQENLEGFKDRATSIVLYAYDDRGRRLRGAYPSVSGGSPAFNTTPSRTVDQSVVPVWWQWPYRSGTFFVRFELFHDKSLLGIVDTKRFHLTQQKYVQFVANCVNRK